MSEKCVIMFSCQVEKVVRCVECELCGARVLLESMRCAFVIDVTSHIQLALLARLRTSSTTSQVETTQQIDCVNADGCSTD